MQYKYDVEYRNGKPWKITAIGITSFGKVYTGISRCAEEDEFNFTTGAEIARKRAELKQLKDIMKNSEEDADYHAERANKAAKKRFKTYLAINKIYNQIEEIKGE